MTFDATDPRLTAFALGELDGAERAEIEALLASSADARRFVDEIRETARILTDHLQAEPSPVGLAPAQRAAIEVVLRPRPPRPALPRWARLSAAAAALVACASLALWVWSRDQKARP